VNVTPVAAQVIAALPQVARWTAIGASGTVDEGHHAVLWLPQCQRRIQGNGLGGAARVPVQRSEHSTFPELNGRYSDG
jgi:hypothetical protein